MDVVGTYSPPLGFESDDEQNEQIIRRIAGRESFYEELDDPESESDTGISKGMR